MAATFDFQKYRYIPSIPAAAISMVVFSTLAAVHAWQTVQSKQWFLSWLVIGATLEVLGYAARIASHFNVDAWAPFMIQGTLLLLPALLFAATVYILLGRTIRLANGEKLSIIPVNWITRIFVGADILTLSVQAAGASMMGTMNLKLAIAGLDIVIAGLALQVVTFCIFILIAWDFHRKKLRKISLNLSSLDTENDKKKWETIMWTQYSVSVLILIRCIFRVLEYSMGNAGFLNYHEVFLYVFDMLPMVLVLLLLAILKPGENLRVKKDEIIEGSHETILLN